MQPFCPLLHPKHVTQSVRAVSDSGEQTMKTMLKWMPTAAVALVMALPVAANVARAASSDPVRLQADPQVDQPVDHAVERLRQERDVQLRREAQRALAQLRSDVESALAPGAGGGKGQSVNATR